MIAILCINIDAVGGVEVVSKKLFNEFVRAEVPVKLYSCRATKEQQYESLCIETETKLTTSDISKIVERFISDKVSKVIIQLNDPYICLLANIKLYKQLNRVGIKTYTVIHNSPKSFVYRYPYPFDSSFVFCMKKIKTKFYYAPKSRAFIKKIRDVTNFISLCEGNKAELMQYFGAKSVVIPNVLDYHLDDDFNLNIKQHTIACIARIDFYAKNFFLLLDAWNSVTDKQDWQLNLIGSGDSKILSDYMEEKGIENIKIIAGKKNEDVLKYLESNSILILTSYHEGFPTVIAEAASKYNAIITTKYDGFSTEIVEDGFSGYVVNFDTNELAGKIQNLISDEVQLKVFQKNAYNKLKCCESIDTIKLWEKVMV